jgi:hypothetical protein
MKPTALSHRSSPALISALEVNLRRLKERRKQRGANVISDAAFAHDLASCVTSYARLGNVDAGIPIARQLFVIVNGDKWTRVSTKQRQRAIWP